MVFCKSKAHGEDLVIRRQLEGIVLLEGTRRVHEIRVFVLRSYGPLKYMVNILLILVNTNGYYMVSDG